MNSKFHRMTQSMLTLAAAVLLQLGGANVAQAEDNANYFGRWTVKDEKPVYSKNGILYKTVDFMPCGKDFCGVSVADNGDCGKTLFRFLTVHAHNTTLTGHGRWGDIQKKVVLNYWTEDQKPVMLIGLGDNDYDPEAREGSMASFEATYKQAGKAMCSADHGSTS